MPTSEFRHIPCFGFVLVERGDATVIFGTKTFDFLSTWHQHRAAIDTLDKLPEYLRDTMDWFMGEYAISMGWSVHITDLFRAWCRGLYEPQVREIVQGTMYEPQPGQTNRKTVEYFIINFTGRCRKGRRKDKDSPTPPVSEETRPYLEEDLIRERITDVDFCKLVSLPPHLDYNEWLATNAISFFNHVNLFYGAISEYCTNSACAVMNAPFNVQYFWQDEKGKKCKCSAPQYTDLVTSFIEKTINDETVFPTKYGNVFPSAFETIVKRIHRYLFQILAHIYQAHFKEVILLSILGHLNSVFLHFMTFNLRFNLLEEKETEVLYDLYKALSQPMPDRNQNEQGPVDRNQSDDNNDVVVDEDGTDVLGKGTGNVENGVIGNGVAGNGFLTNDVTGSGDAGHDPQQQQQQQQTGSRDECVTGNGNRKLILTDSHVLQTLEDHRSVVSAERLTVTELIAPDSAANSNSIQQPAAILTT